MKSIRGFALGLAAGIAVAIGTVGLAQTTKPADQSQKAESCCAMASCCKGHSGAMHKGRQHAQGQNKHEGGCCCCGGDSCEMQMKTKEQAKEKQE